MKVYPASRSRDLCHEAVQALLVFGHEVVHDWASGPRRALDATDAAIARVDLAAIDRCDVVLIRWSEGLRAANTELGYALGRGKKVILQGCTNLDENIFYRLPEVTKVDTLKEALALLAAWEVEV